MCEDESVVKIQRASECRDRIFNRILLLEDDAAQVVVGSDDFLRLNRAIAGCERLTEAAFICQPTRLNSGMGCRDGGRFTERNPCNRLWLQPLQSGMNGRQHGRPPLLFALWRSALSINSGPIES